MNGDQETLVLRRGRYSLPLSLLMPTFALLIAPANLAIHLRCHENAPLPPDIQKYIGTTASVIYFMPDYYPCLIARLVSCYALFK